MKVIQNRNGEGHFWILQGLSRDDDQFAHTNCRGCAFARSVCLGGISRLCHAVVLSGTLWYEKVCMTYEPTKWHVELVITGYHTPVHVSETRFQHSSDLQRRAYQLLLGSEVATQLLLQTSDTKQARKSWHFFVRSDVDDGETISMLTE